MVILADNFEGSFEWVQLVVNPGSGNAFQFAPSGGRGGGGAGYQPRIAATEAGSQDRGLDPDGGYRLLPGGDVTRRSNGGLRMEWYYKHDGVLDSRGDQMRAGLLNGDLNGYTLAVKGRSDTSGDPNVHTIRLEKRTGAQVDTTMAAVTLSQPDAYYASTWFRCVLELDSDGSFTGSLYTTAGVLVDQVTAVADVLGAAGFYVGRIPISGGTFETFDRVAAVGGCDWYIDDLTLDYVTPP